MILSLCFINRVSKKTPEKETVCIVFYLLSVFHFATFLITRTTSQARTKERRWRQRPTKPTRWIGSGAFLSTKTGRLIQNLQRSIRWKIFGAIGIKCLFQVPFFTTVKLKGQLLAGKWKRSQYSSTVLNRRGKTHRTWAGQWYALKRKK